VKIKGHVRGSGWRAGVVQALTLLLCCAAQLGGWLPKFRDKQPTHLNCLTLEEGADSPEISVTKHQRMRKIFNLKIKFYMVLRSAFESFSSHEMLRTAVQCQVEIV